MAHISITTAAELLSMNTEVVRRAVARAGYPTFTNARDRREVLISDEHLLDLARLPRRGQKLVSIQLTWQNGPNAGQTVTRVIPVATKKARARTERG
jgi:hypothetical protein